MTDELHDHFESADETTLPDESRIRALLEELLETGSDPEQVSGGNPKLERVLRQRLRRARDVQAELEAMFPSPHMDSGEGAMRRAALEGPRKDEHLPDIPGYEVNSVIGTGGMGVVYRARHLKLDRWVAIKMVLLGAYASREQRDCLLREARDVAALRHPNIVQVYDVAEHDGFPFFAMEFLDGGDLAQTLQGNPRPAREAADLIRVLAGAVHAAHLGGIVHRDLKPGNIFLCSDGSPKIGDFSLARRLEHDSTLMTHARQAGTPSYMAPEQAAGDPAAIQPAVDIYALGAILYELLTGRPPFKAETSTETRRQVIVQEPAPPSQLNSRVPRDLQTICLKCLQKDPARRYASAADLAEDLERFMRGDPIRARPIGATERTLKWCRRRPAMTLAIAVSVAAVIGSVAGGIWLDHLEHARQTELLVRRERARTSIESALPLMSEMVQRRQWSDAEGVLRSAQVQMGDAQSVELNARLSVAEEELAVARELERIRESIQGPSDIGYTDQTARIAFAHILRRIGIGSDVGVEPAAQRVRHSPLREQLLEALDYAAFAERSNADDREFRRLLAVGRTAAPNPWQDRFRDPATWQDLASLQRLVQDAADAEPAPPSHQMVMIGLQLGLLNDNDSTINILQQAQLHEPSDFWVNLELAHAYRRDEDFAFALQFYQAAAALQPNHFVVWSSIGWTLISSEKYEDAVAPLRKAIALRPEYTMSWHYLIQALGYCERWDEALAAEREAASASPAFKTPAARLEMLHIGRARSAAAKRQWQIAAESYAHCLNGSYAGNSHALFESAAVRALAGDAPGYREVCALVLARCESAQLRRFLVARTCTLATVSDQELARAAELGLTELDIYVDHYWSLRQRAALLCRDAKPRQAIAFLERSLQSTPTPEHHIVTWAWLARAHLSLGDHDAAKHWLAKAVDQLDQSDIKPEAIHLHDWLEAHILCREVESMLAE